LGAIIAYIVLDVIAVSSRDIQTVRAAYIAMELTVLYAIVPLALASLLVGIINALGTAWGLFRHYWVLAKLLLTLVATTVLLIETRTISYMAEVAASGADPRELPGSLVHSVGGLLVLLIVTVLSVYKPKGVTRYGWRRQLEQSERRRPTPAVDRP
jgi:ABC-type anion transport system duplicated permease subunit